jgi:uncharacterized damage-inducible protein DinB
MFLSSASTIRAASDERTTLVDFLEFHRARVLWVIEGLDQAALARRFVSSSSTLGGIVKHLGRAEDLWFQQRLHGRPMPEPWASAPFSDHPTWDFDSASQSSPEEIRDGYMQACVRSRESIEGLDLETLTVMKNIHGDQWNLRWLLIHMIEETAQHSGHLDILRELLTDAGAAEAR